MTANIDFSNITFNVPFSSTSENLRFNAFTQSQKPNSLQPSKVNTYYNFNSKNPKYQMIPESNDVLFNLVTKQQNELYKAKHPGKQLDAFSLWLGLQPSHRFDITSPSSLLKDINTYYTTDVAEVIRADLSRLFFDIDIDSGDYSSEEFTLTFSQIKEMLRILNIPISSLHGFYEGVNPQAKLDLPAEFAPQLIALYNPHASKEFSAHLYISGYYFDRNDLFKLFSQGTNHFNRDPSSAIHLAKYIDLSVYVSAGASKAFRFGLSGKMNSHRDPPQLSQELVDYVYNNLNNYVANKTSLDTNFISGQSAEFNQLLNFMVSFKSSKVARPGKIKGSKEDIVNLLTDEAMESSKEAFKYIAKKSTHTEWYISLINEMKKYLVSSPQATDEELFNYFSQEQFQYFSNSRNKRLYQPPSINGAIRDVRNNPTISVSSIFEEHFLNSEYAPPEAQTEKECLKYTLSQFIKFTSHPVEYPRAAELIHFTFIFYERMDQTKTSANFITFKDSRGKVTTIPFMLFEQTLKTSPINLKLLMHDGTLINCSIVTAFRIFDKFKQRFYDFCTYSLNPKFFSMYTPEPLFFDSETKPKEQLPEAIHEILKIIATEDGGYINNTKIDYILNWFAYIIQHPESRNSTALQISTVQGTGKNILSNAICRYLGEDFSLSNGSINNVLGNFNGDLENKLLVVVNEVDTTQKDSDRLKSVITDSDMMFNHKYGLQYTGKNTASYLFYTNHIDTKTISNGDRRFTYIRSYGLPKPKSFYASICQKGTDSQLLPEIQKQFIAYLKSRDISNYNPCEAEEFDKRIIEDQKESSRSSVYKVLKIILEHNYINQKIDYILQSEFIDLINKTAQNNLITVSAENPLGTLQTLGEYLNIPELDDLDSDIKEEFGKNKLTTKILNNIITHEDDKNIEKIKSSRRDSTRNKHILKLVNPLLIRGLTTPEPFNSLPSESAPITEPAKGTVQIPKKTRQTKRQKDAELDAQCEGAFTEPEPMTSNGIEI